MYDNHFFKKEESFSNKFFKMIVNYFQIVVVFDILFLKILLCELSTFDYVEETTSEKFRFFNSTKII